MTINQQPHTKLWHNEPSILENAAFRQFGRRFLYAEINGARVGAVRATRKPGFNTFALNKPEFDRLIAGKQNGRIDRALVVKSETDASGVRTYPCAADAEELHDAVLINLQPRSGPYGEFWVLPPDEDDEPF